MTILVVDDEKMVLGVTRAILQMAGHEVLAAATAEEALRLCEEEPIDLVISDVLMPGMSGRELAECISRLPASNIRIILMSGYVDGSEPVSTLLRNGRLDNYLFLHKPFRPQELLAVVDAAISS